MKHQKLWFITTSKDKRISVCIQNENKIFGSLDRDKLLPEVNLGFLEKGLLPPENCSFSLEIQLNRR